MTDTKRNVFSLKTYKKIQQQCKNAYILRTIFKRYNFKKILGLCPWTSILERAASCVAPHQVPPQLPHGNPWLRVWLLHDSQIINAGILHDGRLRCDCCQRISGELLTSYRWYRTCLPIPVKHAGETASSASYLTCILTRKPRL